LGRGSSDGIEMLFGVEIEESCLLRGGLSWPGSRTVRKAGRTNEQLNKRTRQRPPRNEKTGGIFLVRNSAR
jgi:hypothetical protein